jgi:hypothetical protein
MHTLQLGKREIDDQLPYHDHIEGNFSLPSPPMCNILTCPLLSRNVHTQENINTTCPRNRFWEIIFPLQDATKNYTQVTTSLAP